MSRLLPLFLAALLCLFLFSLPTHSQSPGCLESQLDLYSVYGRTNQSLNGSSVLLNISTTLGVNNYTAYLPSAYPYGFLWIQVVVPLTATFNVTCNATPQLNLTSNSPTFYAQPGGTFLEVAPINGLGAVTATNVITITISNVGCTYQDTFNVINSPSGAPTSPSRVLGDPMFAGLRGQQYQVHGIDGAVYNLISDPYTQINSRFVFLNGPRLCPILPSTGKKAATCWSHPGSYLGQLGVKTSADDRIFIQAGSAVDGFKAITLNGRPVKVEAEVELRYSQSNLPSGLLSVNNTHEVSITVGFFTLVVENIDGFLNLRSVKVDSEHWSRLASHGLLGQTWANRRYEGRVPEIEGEVDDYVVEEDHIFGDNFVFNKFEQ